MVQIHVMKKDGHIEEFDSRKILLGSFEACMNAQLSRKVCEKVSEAVTDKLTKQYKKVKKIKSDNIFKDIAKELKKHSKEAAFMFETHRDIS